MLRVIAVGRKRALGWRSGESPDRHGQDARELADSWERLGAGVHCHASCSCEGGGTFRGHTCCRTHRWAALALRALAASSMGAPSPVQLLELLETISRTYGTLIGMDIITKVQMTG